MRKVKRNKDLKFIGKIAQKTGGFPPSLGTKLQMLNPQKKQYVSIKSHRLAPMAFFLGS
jgi:hypothetical protein